MPLQQNGITPVHVFPQRPQLLRSVCSFTQVPAFKQYVRPPLQTHAPAVQVVPCGQV
jgi:hypothetical protein